MLFLSDGDKAEAKLNRDSVSFCLNAVEELHKEAGADLNRNLNKKSRDKSEHLKKDRLKMNSDYVPMVGSSATQSATISTSVTSDGRKEEANIGLNF
ncbi:hypothetical protein MLD38_008350 [Melastoma candidum]|uniref:Uncharacterized protein n=1 Tax=Melastoma candidum TaxID=119954 RepID=A0ACB9RVW9_9MYRT|nr:hypothetical protein MLD38_008350 [Melastoma candidum]